MGGTPSGEKAVALLEQYFTRLGLKTEVFTDPPKPAHWEDHWRVALGAGEGIESAGPEGFSPPVFGPDPGEPRRGREGPPCLGGKPGPGPPHPGGKEADASPP